MHSLRFHKCNTTRNYAFWQLHVGNAVYQKAARALVAFVLGNGVTAAVQKLRHGKASGTRPNNGNRLAASACGDLRLHESLVKRGIDDETFVVVYGNGACRGRCFAARARAFARRGAHVSRELGEAIRFQQTIERHGQIIAPQLLVPFGNQVIERTTYPFSVKSGACLAKRNTAVHATRRLLHACWGIKASVNELEIGNARGRRTVGCSLACVINESSWLSHDYSSLSKNALVAASSGLMPCCILRLMRCVIFW